MVALVEGYEVAESEPKVRINPKYEGRIRGMHGLLTDDEIVAQLTGLDKKVDQEGYVPELNEVPILQDYRRFLPNEHLKLLEAEGRTEEQKRIIATIEVMPPSLFSVLANNYEYPSHMLGAYNREQLSWVRTAKKLNDEWAPQSVRKDDDYVGDSYAGHGTPLKFRIFFALENSEVMERKAKKVLPAFSGMKSLEGQLV